jgi:hypothetical protein
MLRNALVILHLLVAIPAIPAGIAMIVEPSNGGALDLDPTWLDNTPFNDYLIPGVILTFVVGAGSLAAAGLLVSDWLYAGQFSVLMGVVLMTWIIAQVTMIPFHWFFHPVYFAIGAAVFVLSLFERRRRAEAYFAQFRRA